MRYYGVRTKDPFDELLQRYRGLLFSLSQRYSRRGTTTEDLLQEVTIALWRVRERVLPLSGVPQAALVWKIARNAAIDSLRRTPDFETLDERQETAADDRQLVRELHERIALLEEPDRTIVRMQLEGYSYEEIGEALGMTEKNVSVRLVRIKDKLRKEWNGE